MAIESYIHDAAAYRRDYSSIRCVTHGVHHSIPSRGRCRIVAVLAATSGLVAPSPMQQRLLRHRDLRTFAVPELLGWFLDRAGKRKRR